MSRAEWPQTPPHCQTPERVSRFRTTSTRPHRLPPAPAPKKARAVTSFTHAPGHLSLPGIHAELRRRQRNLRSVCRLPLFSFSIIRRGISCRILLRSAVPLPSSSAARPPFLRKRRSVFLRAAQTARLLLPFRRAYHRAARAIPTRFSSLRGHAQVRAGVAYLRCD